LGSVNLVGPLTHSVLYLRQTYYTRLALKLFRVTAMLVRDGIRSLVEKGRQVAPQPQSVSLPPSDSGMTPARKLFRGEPDICEFD
jgi:hypothetical protein